MRKIINKTRNNLMCAVRQFARWSCCVSQNKTIHLQLMNINLNICHAKLKGIRLPALLYKLAKADSVFWPCRAELSFDEDVTTATVPLHIMKGCICHFTTWQIHPFISKGTNHNPKIQTPINGIHKPTERVNPFHCWSRQKNVFNLFY